MLKHLVSGEWILACVNHFQMGQDNCSLAGICRHLVADPDMTTFPIYIC